MPGQSFYFDCNATTPTLPAASAAALEAMNTLYGNPSSAHVVGLQARHILEGTRKIAAEVVGSRTDQIIFTSGATEAIQTAIFSALEAAKDRGIRPERNRLLYGATEHKAVPEALQHWVKALSLPLEVVPLPVNERGQIRTEALLQQLPHALLLCTMAVNNDTGVIQDLAAIESEIHRSGSDVLWLVDCVQALGKQALKLGASRIDYAPFSGHKLYAPKGIGFLYKSDRAPLVPLIVGGGQERGLRSGTENLPGVAAFGAVLKHLVQSEGSPFQSRDQLLGLRTRVAEALRQAFPKVEFNTPFEISVPTTINFSVPGFSSKELMDLFDSAGIRLSAGSACSSASVKPSHVLDAMGVPEWRSVSALRLSFGPCTSSAEIEAGCRALLECAMALQNSCLLDTAGAFEAPDHLRDGVIQFRSGPTNSWVLSDRDSRSCIVIDPCDAVAERMEHYIRCQNLRVVAVLDTHSHADHVSIRPALQTILGDRMLSTKVDSLGWPEDLARSARLGEEPAQVIDLGADRFLARLPTPGHTDDSLALFFGRAAGRPAQIDPRSIEFLFSGDTILTGGLGRTNFSMSDPAALRRSLELISRTVASSTLICPAHDYNNSFATSLATETRENPLLSLALSSEASAEARFVERKREIDQELARLEKSFQGIVCGVSDAGPSARECNVAVSAAELRSLAGQGGSAQPLVIDVREPQEYTLSRDWESLGLLDPPRNVPLSRFVNLMHELMREGASGPDPAREIILLCRSGNRSLQAARSLRRLGFSRARSLDGGLALV